MSDTPRTDELAKRDFITDGVWIRHARELERENAELREALVLIADGAESAKGIAKVALGKEAQP